MSKQYWHCGECGGNFDLGEKCDCEPPLVKSGEVNRTIINKEIPVFGAASELLVLGVDMSEDTFDDIPCISVMRYNMDSMELVNVIFGEEARKIYEEVTGLSKTVKDVSNDILESREDAANR